MEPGKYIDEFLLRVRRKRRGILTLKGIYLVLAFLTGCFLLGNLLSYFFADSLREFGLPLGIVIAVAFVYLLVHCFLRDKITAFSVDQAALLTEQKFPDLDNSLINASQLQRRLSLPEGDREVSHALIEEQVRRTHALVAELNPEAIVDSTETNRNRNWFLGAALSLFIATIALPDFLSRGIHNLVSPLAPMNAEVKTSDGEPAQKEEKTARYEVAISDLKLTFSYPAYSGLQSRVVHPSDGNINVLPGTEVQVEGTANAPIAGGELVWNGNDNFSMRVFENKTLSTQFFVKERGYYQFRIKDPEGARHLLPKKYTVALTRDQPPGIVLFIANPKPVYYANAKIELFYEAQDDFGIQQIDLVAYVNGKPVRRHVKRVKNGESEIQGSYTWTLAEMAFEPGDEVEYFMEILDNDNVRGPNKGQSETFSFIIFNSREEMENLIVLQDELTEKMIAELATSLVTGVELKATPVSAMKWKNHLISSADSLIEIIGLAQKIRDRAKTLEHFPRPYFSLLNNIINGLNEIRDEQINAINKIENTINKPTPVGYSVLDLDSINQRLTSKLETNILFLVRMTNRQKMDQVMEMENRLNELTESLKEEFDKILNKKNPMKSEELVKKVDQIRETLEKIMDQLARQTQSLPDEFLNPEAFKGMNMEQFTASLDKIMDLMKRGKMGEAQEELKKMAEAMKNLTRQLDQAQSDMEDLVGMETMRQLDDSLDKIQELEKKQKKLLEQTAQINKSLRDAQSKMFADPIQQVFAEIKQLVNKIQATFQQNGKFLDEHPTMKTLSDLLDKETKINQKLRLLSQETVDSNRNPNLQDNFIKLNSAKTELARIMEEMDSLRVRVFQRFKNTLPRLQRKYGTLEELAQLHDLNEFNNLFKNTYPEVFQWQNNIRTTPNKREDLGERILPDLRQVTRLNSEISKKLGSMMRMIQNSDEDLLSEENKADLQKMANDEKKLKEESEELMQQFGQMNKQNPTVTPELNSKMSRASRYMGRAQSNLKQKQVQRSINAENRALKELQETREMLKEMKEANSEEGQQASRSTAMKFGTGQSRDSRRGGSVRMQKEKVNLPSEDQYKVPGEFREEILRAMKKHTPQDYQRLVSEYYKELVK
jgi:tetratricopeptide (TPR) repeat protein